VTQIVLGKAGRGSVEMDLDILTRTRMLVQANSGGGKSWFLRRIAEQVFGKIQVMLVDPEGEFATLRESYGYVLVGKGGETPADPRSAALVAEKLLELRSSAVCDLYEMKAADRHRWVRMFLEALIDAPKKLWRPLLVIVDEAHNFCPEKGAGESEASDAMIGLATRGRKRGYCAVFATQRLGKLRKDAAAELLNILIGPTFIDIDRKRAAEALGVHQTADQRKFFDEVKVLEPGNFYALGRAICKERVLVRVGPVKTTHPESGSTKHAAGPPPTPEKVRLLLPKLKDLPKEAEAKAKTVAELQQELRSLRMQVRAKPAAQPQVRTVVDKDAVRKAVVAAVAARDKRWNEAVMSASRKVMATSESIPTPVPTPAAQPPGRARVPQITPELAPRRIAAAPADMDDGDLSNPQLNILKALAEFSAIGRDPVPRPWVAAKAGVSHKSSGYSNNLSALKTRALIDYGAGSTVTLTDEGRSHVPEVNPPETDADMLDCCLRIVSRPQGDILKALHERYPAALVREDLAEAARVSAASSGFSNNLSGLKSAGMVEYGPNRSVRCAEWLFVEALHR
jgi:hypothetical protein